MKSRNAQVIAAWTASAVVRSRSGAPRGLAATAAPNTVRISTQSSMEPSWLPHTPETL